jgi:hypothetical protein
LLRRLPVARNVFRIIDDLARIVEELRDALAPLAKIAGGDQPVPQSTKRPSVPIARAPKRDRRSPFRKVAEVSGAGGRPLDVVSAVPKPRRRRKATLTPRARAAYAAQGRYLGAIRPLRPGDRAKVKKERAEKGLDAALKLAASLTRLK